jgi:hypothetical protein
LEDQHDHCGYQQQVDESSQRVTAHKSYQPQNEEDHENCPKHLAPPEAKIFASKQQQRVGRTPVRVWLFAPEITLIMGVSVSNVR